MSYRNERERFIAAMTREGLPFDVALGLLRAATTMNRYAELACSSEAADRDRVPCPAATHIVRQYGSATDRPMQTRILPRKPTGPCLCDRPTHVLSDEDTANARPGANDHETVPRITVLDWQVQRRVTRMIDKVNAKLYPATAEGEANRLANGLWRIETQGDPRGCVLKVIPPSYAAENAGRPEHDQRSIGVPSGPSGIRW